MSNSFEKTWETYVASWKAPTPEAKQRLFEQALARDCCYTDPLTQAKGWAPLIAYIAEFHRQVPGGHFVTKRFIVHHDRSVAYWDMCNAAGEVLGDGVSFGEYDEVPQARSEAPILAQSAVHS